MEDGKSNEENKGLRIAAKMSANIFGSIIIFIAIAAIMLLVAAILK